MTTRPVDANTAMARRARPPWRISHAVKGTELESAIGMVYCTRDILFRICFRAAVLILCLLSAQPSEAQETEDSLTPIHAASDLGDLIGKPIQQVQVVQTGRWRSEALVTSVKIGEPMTGAAARRAAQELLNTGGFSDVQVFVERSGQGVRLRLEAVPRRLIAARRLVGSTLDATELWQTMGLRDGDELTDEKLVQIQKQVQDIHRSRGYPRARVSVQTRDTDARAKVVLIVQVDAGPPLMIADRIFIMPDATWSVLSDVAQRYRVSKADRLDEEALASANVELEEDLRARRYPMARVRHSSVVKDGFGFVYVYVQAGPHLRFRFEGNERFDADQLTDVLDYDKQLDRTAAALTDRLASFYRRYGFLDVEIHAESRGTATDLVNELVFHIREGEIVQVYGKEFPCLRGGPRSVDALLAEVDGVLTNELPGGSLIGSVDPKIVDATLGPKGVTGARPSPLEPDPTRIYDPATYDKVVQHVRGLVPKRRILSAMVGPVRVLRRTCHRHSPPGQCVPLPLPSRPSSACQFDPRGLPVDDEAPDARLQCRPDRARAITCEPRVWLHIPVKLGPRAMLYDVAFDGNRSIPEADLLEASELDVGQPASNLELEKARRRVIQAYREMGFAYAEVRATLDLSPDHTRARARFIVNESQQVIVDKIIVVGAERTSEPLIIGRVSLKIGQPYRASDVRKTEERIATLGTFSSVAVSLQDAYVPARRKTVVIQVQERLPQYLDIRPGFSTGEGVRIQFEYGHLNIAGEAIRFTLRLRLSYLPDVFILDEDVRNNLDTLPMSRRLERHNTASVLFPEIGLGPLVSLNFDGIDVRSNARDFGLSKNALATTLNIRPFRTLSFGLGGSLERNDVAIFSDQSVIEYLQRPGVTGDLRRLLLAPDGLTLAVAQLATVSWDRRDNPLGATRGTLLGGSVEHVRAFPGEDNPNTKLSDFLRVSGIVSAYLPLNDNGLTLAASMRAGRIIQMMSSSDTYPDRLFFLGGVDSVRGFLRDSVVPQDVAERILQGSPQDPNRLTVNQVAIRGGDVFLNPRLELRIPMTATVHTTLFMDSGNVWVEPEAFEPWKLRYASGSGLRIATPIGPLAFDYGINLDRRSWEDFGAFHFSIGLF